MPPYHCRAPGCGRFVSAEGDICARHTEQPAGALDPEIMAIRSLLKETQTLPDIEAKAKLIPRIVSVSIQAIKTDHQLGNQAPNALLKLLEEIESEIEPHPDRHPERSRQTLPEAKSVRVPGNARGHN